MRAVDRRWPVSALIQVTGLSVQQIAVQAGRCRRTGIRWSHRDTLNDRQADHAACALGLHPALIWPDWFAAAPEDDLPDTVPQKATGGALDASGITHEVLTVREAATVLGVEPDTVERLVEAGVLERLRWKYDRRAFVSNSACRRLLDEAVAC